MCYTAPTYCTSTLTRARVRLSCLGRLWRSSVQCVRQSQVFGRSSQLGWRLRAQKQTWHLHKSHQIPWLDQRKDGSVDHWHTVKRDQRYGHEHMLMTHTTVWVVTSVKHHSDFLSDVVASTSGLSCSGKCTHCLKNCNTFYVHCNFMRARLMKWF